MRVVIANSVALNGGDAAILLALITLVRRRYGQQTQITVLDKHPRESAKYLPGIEFEQGLHVRSGDQWPFAGKRRWLDRKLHGAPRAARLVTAAKLLSRGSVDLASMLCSPEEYRGLRRIQEADLVVSTGGTYLVPHYSAFNKLLELRVAYALNTPYVLYTQSIGDFRGHHLARAVAGCLQRAALVLLRDADSLSHVRALGVASAKCRVVPDVVFSMVDLEQLGPRSALDQCSPLRVTVSVRDWRHFKSDTPAQGMARYKHAVATVLTELIVERGAEVRFLSTCQGVAEYAYDDSTVAQEIAQLIPEPQRSAVTVIEDHLSPERIRHELTQTDLLIATRMHMAILGLCAGTPVLPIAYEFKTQELFKNLGFAGWVESIDLVTAEHLRAKVKRVMAEAHTRRDELVAAIRQAKHDADASIALVPNSPAARERPASDGSAPQRDGAQDV